MNILATGIAVRSFEQSRLSKQYTLTEHYRFSIKYEYRRAEYRCAEYRCAEYRCAEYRCAEYEYESGDSSNNSKPTNSHPPDFIAPDSRRGPQLRPRDRSLLQTQLSGDIVFSVPHPTRTQGGSPVLVLVLEIRR